MSYVTRQLGRTLLVAMHILLFDTGVIFAAEHDWRIAPSYESRGLLSETALIVRDREGLERTLYDRSYAVLIVEGAYTGGAWSSVTDIAEGSADLLKIKLEKLGFHVLIWKDQPGLALRVIVDDVRANIGYIDEARLFFYYFGHGYSLGTGSNIRTFLVPVDAPDPVTDRGGFLDVALPVSSLKQLADDMTLKHAFFALEACKSGGLIATLSAPDPPNPDGYLFGQTVEIPVRQFLTAGNSSQEVPANGAFTALLTAAISGESRNADGYVYGTDVMSYVSHQLPRFSTNYPLSPQYGSIPPAGGGDFIFGRASNDAPVLTQDQVWEAMNRIGRRLVFNENSAVLGDQARQRIKEVSHILRNHGDATVELDGYKLPGEDTALSKERCDAIRAEFRLNGIVDTECYRVNGQASGVCKTPCGYFYMDELMYRVGKRE